MTFSSLCETNPVPGRQACAHLFWLAAGLHLALWTLAPALTSHNAPLDVIEGYAWGREWLIGTYKHPPMQSWILEIAALLTGRAGWAHFLASQLAIAAAFWAVWRIGLRLTDCMTALPGVLLLEGVAYYNFTSPEFNPNVLQLPFWALACLSFHRAVTEDRRFDWLLLGIWAACGMYTKYSMAVLLVVLAGLLALHHEARRRLRGPGPYISLAVALLLLSPHLIWLAENDFMPFFYAESRTAQAVRLYQRLTQPLMFLMAQALSLSAMFVLFLFSLRREIRWSGGRLTRDSSFDRAFLHAITFGPVAIVLALSAAFGFRPRDMWGSCLWNFIGLWLAVFMAGRTGGAALKRFAWGWFVVFFLGLAAIIASNILYPYIKNKPLRVHFPGREIAETATQEWRRRFGKPLEYAIGDTWLAGNVAYYAPGTGAAGRPHVVIFPGMEKTSPWASLGDIRAKGGVLLWFVDGKTNADPYAEMPAFFQEKFPEAEIQKTLYVSPETGAPLKPVAVGWAVLPPVAD